MVGVLRPQAEPEDHDVSPIGFGLWKRDARMRDVKARIDRLRRVRHRR